MSTANTGKILNTIANIVVYKGVKMSNTNVNNSLTTSLNEVNSKSSKSHSDVLYSRLSNILKKLDEVLFVSHNMFAASKMPLIDSIDANIDIHIPINPTNAYDGYPILNFKKNLTQQKAIYIIKNASILTLSRIIG
tara:strand:+ start:2607 stop:3014 length:408 start_codon:yes stop_codon:yes gene_type:complete